MLLLPLWQAEVLDASFEPIPFRPVPAPLRQFQSPFVHLCSPMGPRHPPRRDARVLEEIDGPMLSGESRAARRRSADVFTVARERRPYAADRSRDAVTSAANSRWSSLTSGCHCTPRANRRAGSSSDSIEPSSAQPVTLREPGESTP